MRLRRVPHPDQRPEIHTSAARSNGCDRGSRRSAAIPPAHPLAPAEFATIRERLIKIAARVIEHVARIRIQLPTNCPDGALFRAVALGLMPSAGGCAPPRRAQGLSRL
jgi:hypothetical protein